jgi:hypothetical protein
VKLRYRNPRAYDKGPTQRGFIRCLSVSQGRFELRFELSVGTGLEFRLPLIDVSTYDGHITAAMGIGVVTLFVTLDPGYVKWLANLDREIKIGLFGGRLVLRPWSDTMGWSSSAPWYLRGLSLDLADAIFGKEEVTYRVIVDWTPVLVPMPEGTYTGMAQFFEQKNKRPLLPGRLVPRVEIKMDKGQQIPEPGKGENAWDCGEDATFGLTTGQCHSIPEAIGDLVGTVLRQRYRHGDRGLGGAAWVSERKKGPETAEAHA